MGMRNHRFSWSAFGPRRTPAKQTLLVERCWPRRSEFLAKPLQWSLALDRSQRSLRSTELIQTRFRRCSGPPDNSGRGRVSNGASRSLKN